MFNIELLQEKSKMQNIEMEKEENIRNKEQNLKNLRKTIKKIANGAAGFALGTIAAPIVGITMGTTYVLSEKNAFAVVVGVAIYPNYWWC